MTRPKKKPVRCLMDLPTHERHKSQPCGCIGLYSVYCPEGRRLLDEVFRIADTTDGQSLALIRAGDRFGRHILGQETDRAKTHDR